MSNVTLRNISSAVQWAIVSGERVEIAPLVQQSFDVRTAEALIAAAAPMSLQVVTGQQAFGQDAAQYDEEEYVWLANNTGSPIAPEYIETQVLDRDTGKLKVVQSLNPVKAPRVIKLERPPVEEEYTTANGQTRSRMVGKKALFLAPYSQLKIKRSEANILLATLEPGTVIKSRRIPDWVEGLESGTIDEIRAFATMLLGDRHELVKSIPSEGSLTKGKGSAAQKKAKVEAAKQEVLQALFFFVADPAVRLPTLSEFREFYFNSVDNDGVDSAAISAAIDQAEKDLELEA